VVNVNAYHSLKPREILTDGVLTLSEEVNLIQQKNSYHISKQYIQGSSAVRIPSFLFLSQKESSISID
jgi:hypothetical protein